MTGETLAARLTRCPRALDADRAATARQSLEGEDPAVLSLVGGAAGSSPYLCDLIAREAEWLRQALADPDSAAAEEIAAAGAAEGEDLPSRLRKAKRRIALISGLCDLGGAWPLERVTGTLTELADAAVGAALRAALLVETRRHKGPDIDLDAAGGMVVLAMGKMGAHELNYSSDIDLICLYDEGRYAPADQSSVRQVFVRATRRMAGWLNDRTAEGYVFRTDLRLRPDAAVTPVCLSMGAAEAYYESVGRTWERAAYIKARPAAGDLEAGSRFLTTLKPFVWRRHLDFAAIEDAHDMRLRIRDHKGLGGAVRLDGHDLKLGRGGIREIEFFTQTRQLIAGGRDPTLRVRGTVEGLARLRDRDWIPVETADDLTTDYRAHREVEHRLQMVADAQTHALPSHGEGWRTLAALMDRDETALRRELEERLAAVHQRTEGFFAPDRAPEQEDGFGEEVSRRWLNYPALRSDRAGTIFARLRPQILTRLQGAARPEEALAQFDRFLAGLPAGVQLFSLFEANPQLTQLIVDICATSPALAEYLSRNAGVLDAVIGGDFFSAWPGAAGLTRIVADAIAGEGDYEAKLDAARRVVKEWHFRVGVHHLRGLETAAVVGAHYADLAEASVAALWPVVLEEFARKHGDPPGRGAVVVGMGSLGAGRLHAASDLDLIVIYDGAGAEGSEGRRPLATGNYYGRATQALVTALSAPMAEGRLYEVDMRLRPSGRQGPVATSWSAFRSYQQDEAWTWEHLALTRARPVAGPDDLADDIETFRRDLLASKSTGASILADVRDMRERIAGAKSPEGGFDAKIGPGRLQDIELFAQTAALRAGSPARDLDNQIAAGEGSGWFGPDAAERLREAATLFWALQSAARLLTGKPLDLDALGEGGLRFVLRETGQASEAALREAMSAADRDAARIIADGLGETG